MRNLAHAIHWALASIFFSSPGDSSALTVRAMPQRIAAAVNVVSKVRMREYLHLWFGALQVLHSKFGPLRNAFAVSGLVRVEPFLGFGRQLASASGNNTR